MNQFTELAGLFGKNGASPERAIHLKSFSEIEGFVMSKLEHLLQQATRAERASKAILDMLTADRLQAFEVECRVRSKTQETEQQTGSPSQPVKPAA